MRVERITPEQSLGKGWARVAFRDCATPCDLASMAIVRPRYGEPFLGKHGWQVSESRLSITPEPMGAGAFSILLAPAVVQYLDVHSNYEFVFFNLEVHRAATVIVRWTGISYRASRGELSPIEVIQECNGQMRSAESASSWPPATPVVQKPAPESMMPPTGSATASPWLVSLSDSVAESPNSIMSSDLLRSEPPSTHDGSVAPPTAAPRVARRIRCIHPTCGAEIFDTMQFCPFCRTPRL
jgi:hypothetical protein